MSGERPDQRTRGKRPTDGAPTAGRQTAARVPEKVIGAKYVRLLEKQIRLLREETAHGNRRLFLDDVFVAYLLAFHNPTVRSLRTLEDLSQTPQAQKHLSVERISRSTLSDFNRLIDPERVVPIIEALRSQLNRKLVNRKLAGRAGPAAGPEHDLNELLRQTVAVDGTFLHAVAGVAWSVANANNHGAVRHRARLDAHLNVSTWLPEAIVVPAAEQSEADSAVAHLQADRIYLYDRGYMSFALLAAHSKTAGGDEADIKSHFVMRYKPAGGNSPELCEAVDRPLTDEDRAAGIQSDRTGSFTSDTARRTGVSRLRLREVTLSYEDNGTTKTLRLITSLRDVSANTVAVLYRYRWQVELFFRWFKSYAHFGHLISHSREGVQTHLYVTIIAVLLMYLHTGHRPSRYMFALLGQVAAGAATLEEILPILRERARQSELDRLSAARRRAKKRAGR